MAFNGDYQQLAAALINQHAIAGAAAAPPPPPEPVAKYGGDRMDVERMESHVAKWLSDNCVDTNATVLQNVRSFMDHVSNAYKGKVALYETRDDMERLPADSTNPIAFSGTVTRLCKSTMMLIQNGKLLAAMLGSDDLDTCLRRLLPLAAKPRVGIMAPRLVLTTGTSSLALLPNQRPAAACS